MTLLPELVKVVVTAIIAISITLAPLTLSGTQKIEQPVIIAATTTPPIIATSTPSKVIKVVKKLPVPSKKGDCKQYEDIISKYGWPVDEAMQICKGESHGDTTNVGDGDTAHVSCGLFQVRTLNSRPTCTQLKDPETNVKWAYKIWKESGWYPWYNVATKLGLLNNGS